MGDSETLAQITKHAGCSRAVLKRTFDHPPEDIWRALTDSSILPQWLAPGTIELKVGGAARLDFGDSGIVINSTVSACLPGSLLEYSWSGPGEPRRPLHWDVAPHEDGSTSLTLTVTIPDGEDVGRGCAGWEAHMEMLAATLEGVPIKFPFETFKAARDAYRAQLAANA